MADGNGGDGPANNTATAKAEEPEWPEHFPAGCPPKDASPTSGDVYRLVAGSTVTEEDVKCWLLIPRGEGKDCQRAGLSVATDLTHAQELTALPLHLGKQVATATLAPEHGKIKRTPTNKDPEHYTLWLRRGALRVATTIFRVRL